MNIVFLDAKPLNPGDLSWKEFQKLGKVITYDRTSPEEVISRSGDADVLVINKVALTEEVLRALPRLKLIVVSATGYNVVDVKAAKEQQIVVCNAPDYSTDAVAQTVFAHILNITNRVGHYAEACAMGKWSASPDFCWMDCPTMEIKNKVLGIVGLGHIGMEVAHIALAFGMKVWALTSKTEKQLPKGIKKKTFEELLKGCDILTLHCPLTPTTERMINAKTLSMMRPHAILINTSRGQLIDEQAVADALTNHRLGAFGGDVLSVEPAEANNPLLKPANAFLTPHIAWATFEARERLMKICADNVHAFLLGTPIHVVN